MDAIVLDRLNKAYNHLKISRIFRTQEEAAQMLGLARTNLSATLNGANSRLTPNFLQKFCDTFDTISYQWLLTGEGSMLRDTPSSEIENELDNVDDFRFRLPVTAEAGSLVGISEGVMPYDCERLPVIKAFPDYDNTILISGDSMSPDYRSGDEVAIKRAKNIMWGYVYVLDTTDGIVIKRIYESGNNIRCSSINPKYPDFELPKEDVYGTFRVVGVLRRGEM